VSANNSGDDCDDCAGVPNGNSYVDNCGTCDADPGNDCTQDCTGAWGGSATIDECGVCGGSGIPEEDCDCDGNLLDAIGVCGGACISDYNANGICDDEDLYGCTYLDASNYNPNATSDDGSCVYEECVYQDLDEDGYDDDSYTAGEASVECPEDDCPSDLNNDGSISTADLLIFLGDFATICE